MLWNRDKGTDSLSEPRKRRNRFNITFLSCAKPRLMLACSMRESSRRADFRPRGARAAVIRVLFTVARILLLSFCVPFILAAHENSFGGRRRWNRDVYLDVNRSHGAASGLAWNRRNPKRTDCSQRDAKQYRRPERSSYFSRPGLGKNRTRQEKNEAMKHMGEKSQRMLPAF